METHGHMNYTTIIQDYLLAKFPCDSKVTEKCIIAVEAYVNLNWKRHFRIISLIRKRTSHAVVIFRAKKITDQTILNINVLDVIPLNLEFRLHTDKTRSPNGDFHPAILSGEDFLFLDIDPFVFPIKSINTDSIGFNRKQFLIDFHKEEFHIFSAHLSNASQFTSKEELCSNFDWLKKLKDEDRSSSDIMDEHVNSESDDDSKAQYVDSSHNTISAHESKEDNLNNTRNSPVKCNISTSLVSSHSLIKAGIIASNNILNPSIVNFERRSQRSIPMKASLDHHQSSPDLINGPFDDIIKNSAAMYNLTNENRQFVYIENKLKQREDDYCNWEDHTLFVGTWNVNGRVDDSLSLNDWLTPPKNVKHPSLYIIGFQEIDLSIGSVALNRGNTSNLEERWLKLIESSKPFKTHRYKRLYRSRLAGILLIVYIEQTLSKSVPENMVSSNKVPTGMFNVMGNKGAVGIRFQALNSKLCFINCHLAAGESNRLRRDQDFKEIEKNLTFINEHGKTISIYEHDLLFLMGDLNYRILNLEAGPAKDLANNNCLEILLANDELINSSKVVFKKFYEGNIEFMPTYKFDPNTDNYDTSEKNRVPSYCDRIMWVGEHCRIMNYSSHMSLKTSDHKPVSALFNVGLKKVDPVKRMQTQEAIIRGMDLIFNSSLPQAKIDKQEINFEHVHFYEHRQAPILITNTGQFEFTFAFKDIPGCPKMPDWLTVQPSEGTVKTGETCELIFEIFINANNVSELNTKPEIQCILVLMLHGGKDYFITVTADLVPTCFGLPLSLVVAIKNPVASFTRKELYEKCKPFIQRVSVPNHGPSEFSTPKEIYVMVDHLLKNIEEDELFARPGSHSEIQSIREQLDTKGNKADFSKVGVHSVIEALLMFLNSLYFPIIPTELIKECMGVHNNFLESVKVISKLPLDHKNLFHYLTSFLRKVLDNRSRNGTDFGSLGILFVDLIFRPRNLENSEREICSHFIKQFLVNDPAKYFLQNPHPK